MQVEQKKQHASVTEEQHATLEAHLQTEREALERKEKEVLCADQAQITFNWIIFQSD